MATIAKEITRLLSEATKEKSVPSLLQAFNTLKELMEENVVVDSGTTMKASYDLYLFCCEAAVFLEQWAVAHHCADRLVENTTTTKAYQIRTLFCRAAIDAQATRSLRCKELVVGVQAALVKVVSGIKQALQDSATLSHLVVMGVKHLWNVGRSLFKEGTFSDIVGTMNFAVMALEKIDFQDWAVRVTWLLRQGTALAGAGRQAEANTVLQKAADLVAKYLPQLKYSVFRTQIALSKVSANPKLKQDAAKGVLRAIYASQAVFCGLVEGAAAEPDLVGAYTELSVDFNITPIVSAQPAPDATAKGGAKAPASPAKKEPAASSPAAATSSEDMAFKEEVFGELGLALALNGDVERASECAKVAFKSRALKARVFGEYTASLCKAIRCGGMAAQLEPNGNVLTPSMISDLVSSVRELERSLESAQRISDVSERNHIVQYGCVLIWNVSLPLLQPQLRSQISRSLQNAAKHLEDIQSNMGLLRTLLYYEAALADMDSDFLNKATIKVDKALGTDYAVDVDEQRLYSLQRPLDRFLVWLKRKLDVRGSVYSKPENVEDETLLIIEQARDAPVSNRLSMLTRAVGLLQDSEPSADYFVEANPNVNKVDDPKGKGAKAPPAKKGKGEDDDAAANGAKLDPQVEARRVHLRNRSSLWHMILTNGWKEKSTIMVAVVKQAATALLSRQWYRRGDRDMRQMQAEAYFTLAQIAVEELRKEGLYVAQRKFFDAPSNEVEDDNEGEDGDEAPEEKSASKGNKSRKPNGKASSGALDEASLAKRIAELTAIVGTAEQTILQNLVEAAKVGVELVGLGFEDQWIVCNAAILLWNFHTKAFQENDFLAPLTALDQIFNMMLAVQIDPKKETTLLKDIGISYVRSLTQHFVKEKICSDPSNPTVANIGQVVRTHLSTFTKVEPNNPRLVKAWEVCDKMINLLPTPMDAKAFLMISASIQRLLGKPADQRQHPQQRLLILLEQLRHPTGVEERRSLLNNTGIDLLAQDPNVELCARLAAASLMFPDNDRITVRAAAIGNQLYQDGKLGWKQGDIASTAGVLGAKGGKGKPDAQATTVVEKAPAEIPSPTAEDWHWYALLLQYQAVALSQLVNPVLQEKPTQWEIRSRALTSITNSAMAALQGLEEYRGDTIRKALRIFRNTCQEFTVDPVARSFCFASLKLLLGERILKAATLSPVSLNPSVACDIDVLSELFVLYLVCLRDKNAVDEGLAALKVAMKQLPSSYHKPFWGFDIQFRCSAGLPTSQTLLRVKEYGAETQAQVWVIFSKYAKSVEDQRFALQSAVDVLEGKPAEQAEHMLLFAQWMLESNYGVTIDVVVDLALSAVDLISNLVDTEAEDEQISEMGSIAGGTVLGKTMGAVSGATKSLGGTMTSTMKAKTVAGAKSVVGSQQAKKRGDKNRTSVKVLKIAVQAYYLLSKVVGNANQHGPMNVRIALSMIVHYIMRLLSTTVAAVNSHNSRLKAKAIKAQKSAAAGHSTDGTLVDPDTIPDEVEIPTCAHGWVGFTFPAHMAESLRNMRSPSAISAATIEGVDTFLALLDDAVSMLAREGMELQAHPALNLMKLIIDVCLSPSNSLTKVVAAATQSTLFNAASASTVGTLAIVHRVADPFLSTNEILALHEDARIAADRSFKSPGDDDIPDRRLKTANIRNDSHLFIHKYWASLARNLLYEGRVTSAQQLIQLATHHAEAHQDNATLARCSLVTAQILLLEGMEARALEHISNAVHQYGDAVDGHTWVEMKLFEFEAMLHLGHFEDALKGVGVLNAVLDSQIAFHTGLARDVALRVVPELQCILSVRFATMASRFVQQDAEIREDMPKLYQMLRNVLQDAIGRASKVSSYSLHSYLLQVELGRLRAVYEPTPQDSASKKLSQRKTLLCREAKLFSMALEAAKSSAAAGVPTESGAIAASPAPQMQVGSILCALGQNILERLELNMKLLQSFRESSFTTMQYPVVEGAPAQLEKQVVYFMRSSRKQRAAEVRKLQRSQMIEEVERKRAKLRHDKQLEIERRREQRKIDAAEALLKKDPKAKPTGKAGQPPPVVDEPDVDPNDKCGIPSPPRSDDEGHGEDSQSDEEEELRLALRDVPDADIESEVRLSFAAATECFSAAQELCGEQSTAAIEAQLGVAAALMKSFLACGVGADQREALLKSEKAPSVVMSKATASKWTKPIELVPEEDPTKVKKKEEAKKPPPKGKDAQVAQPVAPPPPVDPKKLQESITIAQFTTIMESVIRQATFVNNVDVLQRAFCLYAECLVINQQYQAAGLAIEAAQAATTNKYVQHLWKACAFADASELVLSNSVEMITRKSPHMTSTPHFFEMMKAVASSRMNSRLRVPNHPWGQSAVSETVAFSQDVCALTAVIAPEGHFLVCFRRPTGVVDVRQVSHVDLELLRSHLHQLQDLDAQRSALLVMEHPDDEALREISLHTKLASNAIFAELHSLWAPFQLLIDNLGPKSHLVLCLDPKLLPYPIELAPEFNKFKSVQRDLSVPVVSAKLQRRNVERYSGNSATIIVDPRRECLGALQGVFGSDEKPKTAQWQLITATLDENKQYRFPGVAQLQRAITNANVTSLVVDACGRFTSLCPIANLATLNLDHLRVVILMDRGVRDVSARRENQSDMMKTPRQQWAELSWNTSLLLLARGVECCISNRFAAAASVNDAMCRAALGNMDKPQVKSFAEAILAVARKIAEDEANAPALPSHAKPFEITPRFSDSVNVSIWGLSTDDNGAGKPGK